MSKLNRRTFLKHLGAGTAVFGMGISAGTALAKAGELKNIKKPEVKGKYQNFQPGKYLEWEKDLIEEKFAIAAGKKPEGGGFHGGGWFPGGGAVTEQDILSFNSKWDPWNPLFNDKAYAQKAGYQNVPARPGFKSPMGGANALKMDYEVGDIFYFGHGPDLREYETPIFAGDTFTSENDWISLEETTVAGSDLRSFKVGESDKLFNQRGELAVKSTTYYRNAYRKIIDGSPAPSISDQFAGTTKDLPPGHYTTDEEYEYIRELWKNEYIRGSQTLYWEDVRIGDEPTWTCSGPVTYMDMIGWHGAPNNIRDQIMNGDTRNMFKDRFGQYLMGFAGMFGGRNIIGERSVFYNHTGGMLISRMVTNYIGDAGFVTKLGWEFEQGHACMRYPREGGELLDKVPYMKGKRCTVHGSEGDTVIAKGYVTDKYINEKGAHIIDLVCWGETLTDDIITVSPVSVRLPSKKG